jgi:hypothetical protein
VLDAATTWAREHVRATGPIEVTHERPWATVARVPIGGGHVWLKCCAPVQAFEVALTVALHDRWPHLLPELVAHDLDRGWMLLGDAGTVVSGLGNPPEAWLAVLPSYAELQRGEIPRAAVHLGAGVPDLRLETWPERYPVLLTGDVPLTADEQTLVASFQPTFERWCTELAARGIADSVQHDDLHHNNLYVHGRDHLVLDWGDASVSHPFASLVVTFRFLEELNGLPRTDPWFRRLRDAYLEPWGSGHGETFDLAFAVGTFAHAIAWVRHRRAVPTDYLPRFDTGYRSVLDRMVRIAGERRPTAW